MRKDPEEKSPLKDGEFSEEAKKTKAEFQKVLDKYKGMKSPEYLSKKPEKRKK